MQFVYLSETADAAAMERAIATYRDSLPRGPLYHDTDIDRAASQCAAPKRQEVPSDHGGSRPTGCHPPKGHRRCFIGTDRRLPRGLRSLLRLSQQMTHNNPSQE